MQDPVIDCQSGEAWAQRRLVKHLDLEELACDRGLIGSGKLPGVGTVNSQDGCNASLVLDLDQKRSPAVLEQFRICGTFLYFDAAFRIDLDVNETVPVEHRLNLLDRCRAAKLIGFGLGQRLAEIIERLHQA